MQDEIDELNRRIAALDPDALRRLEEMVPTAPEPEDEARLQAAAPASSLIPLREGVGTPVVLAAPSIGDLRKLKSLALALRPRPVFGLLPGEAVPGRRAQALRDDLAARAVVPLRAAYPAGPIVLGGFCMAGLFALDVAHAFLRQGGQVSGMVLVDTFFTPSPLARHLARVWELARHHALGFREQESGARIRYVAERLAAVPRYLRKRRGQREWLATATAADGSFAATIEAFRFASPRTAPAPLLFVCSAEGTMRGSEGPRRRAWTKLAASGLQWVSFPASHESLFEERHVATLAREIARFLDDLPGS